MKLLGSKQLVLIEQVKFYEQTELSLGSWPDRDALQLIVATAGLDHHLIKCYESSYKDILVNQLSS